MQPAQPINKTIADQPSANAANVEGYLQEEVTTDLAKESIVLNELLEVTASERNRTPTYIQQVENYCALLADQFRSTVIDLDQKISNSESLNTLDQALSILELDKILQKEIQRENEVEQGISQLQNITTQIEKDVFNPLKKRYQSVTGLFDEHSSVLSITSGIAGLTTFALSAYLVISNEHNILHACNHLAHALLGDGAAATIASGATKGAALFAQGLFCLAGSLIGPSAVGFIKTVGGRFNRSFSTEGQLAFNQTGAEALKVKDIYQELIRSAAGDIRDLQPVLWQFYNQNEKTRLAISSKLISTDLADSEAHTELYHKSTALGAAEFITLMRSLNIERSVRSLGTKEFRSPELVYADNEIDSKQIKNYGIIRGFSYAANFISSLFQSATTIGKHTALGAAQDSRETFEQLPKNAVSDVVSGMGSGISTTLQLALETGSRPDKTAYAFAKGVVGMAKSFFIGGIAEGPKLETLLKVIFELDELEKGNRLRWASKLIPCIIRAATQKPALMERAQQLEEASGNISPKALISEMAERQGRLEALKKMSSEIKKLVLSTLAEGVEQYLFVLPLRNLEKSSLIDTRLPELSDWAQKKLSIHQEAVERKDRQLMQKDLDALSDGAYVSELTDSELDLYAIERYIEYSYRPEAKISQKEISTLLHYWSLRRKESWHESKEVESLHLNELEAIHPKLSQIHKILNTQNGLFMQLGKVLLHGKDQNSDQPKLLEDNSLEVLVDAWSKGIKGDLKTETNLVLDSTRDCRAVAMLNTKGEVSLIKAGELKQLYHAGEKIIIPKHADQARITVSEMLISSKLEPFQRRALLEAHHQLLAGKITVEEATDKLLMQSFSKEQLLGSTNQKFLGLIPLGIIGDGTSQIS
jgi:hypothetical protein